MKTRVNTLFAAVLAMAVACGGWTWAEEGGKGGGGKERIRQHKERMEQRREQVRKRILERLDRREARIEKRIEFLKEKLAQHPNAPAEVKAAAEKLIEDLAELKNDLEKLEAAIAAADREAAKAARAEVKEDREAVRADRKALIEAIRETCKEVREFRLKRNGEGRPAGAGQGGLRKRAGNGK